MKEICSIIRMNRINETKRALADAGFPSITVRKVVGRGKGLVNYLIQAEKEGTPEEMDNVSEIGPKLLPKRMITVVVPDALKERAMEVIIKANQTQKPGDGKIFVMPVTNAIRIRTGEEGDPAIDEQTGNKE